MAPCELAAGSGDHETWQNHYLPFLPPCREEYPEDDDEDYDKYEDQEDSKQDLAGLWLHYPGLKVENDVYWTQFIPPSTPELRAAQIYWSESASDLLQLTSKLPHEGSCDLQREDCMHEPNSVLELGKCISPSPPPPTDAPVLEKTNYGLANAVMIAQEEFHVCTDGYSQFVPDNIHGDPLIKDDGMDPEYSEVVTYNFDSGNSYSRPPLPIKLEQSGSHSSACTSIIYNGRPPSSGSNSSLHDDDPSAEDDEKGYSEQAMKSEEDENMDAELFPGETEIMEAKRFKLREGQRFVLGYIKSASMVRIYIERCLEKLLVDDQYYTEEESPWDHDQFMLWEREQYDQNRDDGVKLVQQLLACAEAVACRDGRQADFLLRQIHSMASPFGDSLQRVTACFVAGLATRMQQLGPGPSSGGMVFPPDFDAESENASALMYALCPYVPFGHFVANSAILEAVEGAEEVHVIDLGMTDGQQWSALIRGLVKRTGGVPRLLRITGVGPSRQKMELIGQALRREALVANLVLEFRAVQQSLEGIAAASLDLTSGETLVVNSVLQLHCVVKESRGSLNAVLQAVHKLQPKILTLVEQDASHNGPFFLGRFTEALHYYSAIFDSLQAWLPRYSTHRVKIEQFHFGREIQNIIACEGPARVERHERVDQWRRRMSRAGFQLSPLRLLALTRRWLTHTYGPCTDAYTLSDEKGCLVLGWKGKPIIAASAWRC